MNEILTKPYEISVWEDRLIKNGDEYEFEEVKLAVIGSNIMTGLNKVYDPVFNKKSNGERTLTFSLKYKYFDPYNENDNIINPFAALLVNERKVKLNYDGEWYEFIVKDHSESSEEYTWTYTCTDAFVLELSKQGYNITFDTELNNNQGTARELAKETLKNTDWQLGMVNVGRQLIAEPIYAAILTNTENIKIFDTDNKDYVSFDNNLNIYLFYSYVANKNGKFVQFILRNEDDKAYVIDSKNVITATNFRIEDELFYKEIEVENDGVSVLSQCFCNSEDVPIIIIGEIEIHYQANRLAYAQLNTYDPVMQRTVDRFSVDGGDLEVYKYTDYTYTTSNVVMNYVTNGDNFNILEDGTLQGWNPYTDQFNNQSVNTIELTTKPKLATGQKLVDLSLLSQIEGFLQVRFNGPRVDANGKIYNTVYNSGIENHLSFINSISSGDKFVFRWRAGIRDPQAGSDVDDLDCLVPYDNLGLVLAKYTSDEPTRFGYYYKHINLNDVIASFDVTRAPIGEQTVVKTLNNYIKDGTFEIVYKLTEDIEVITGKTYYIYDTENERYDEIIPQEGQNPKEQGWYESYQNYVIDGVPQEPSTRYIYVNKNDETDERVWNGLLGNYEPLELNVNYLPYYYIIGTAKKGVSNTELRNIDKDYGLFFYSTAEDVPTKETEINKILATGNVSQANLPKKEVETIKPKYGTIITVNSNNNLSHNFTAGITDTYTESTITYTYNSEKNTVTIENTEGIKQYTITYTEIIPIYIQDIQFTRFIPDEDGETPVIMGNIPTATSNYTEYYYIQPDEDAIAEEIQTYINDEGLQQLIVDNDFETVTPLYNEDSEKNLTITATQSNCFNILQTIAETFECWINLVVEHDETGKIVIDSNSGRPRKYVQLLEYVGKDNHAGFKYGINLNTIERTVNSEEFVTKLIVDQSQCEYVDEGYVSIASAPSNLSKESYILNFEYYYSQGLLNRDAGEKDRLAFTKKMNDINLRLSQKETERRNLEASLTSLGSNRNVYSELITSAKDIKNNALTDFKELTNETYDEYREKHGILIDGQEFVEEYNITEKITTITLEKYPSYQKTITISIPFATPNIQTCTCGTISHINSQGSYTIDYDGDQVFTFNFVNNPGVDAKITFTYIGTDLKQLTDEQTIYDILGEIYTSSATINNYSGLLTNVNQEYDKIHEQLYGYLNYYVKIWVDWDKDKQRHIYIEINDYLVGFKFKLNNDENIYEVTTSKKYFDISSTDATTITFMPPEGYTVIPSSEYEINNYQVTIYKIVCEDTKIGLVDEIKEIREEKEAEIKKFNTKYSHFIQEGTWNSTDYIDSEKYYLDALQVSNTSAEPVVTYTINVVEISQLEGFEWYHFDTGDKSYIEDTEFFGWELIDNVLTPIQEEVIVSEVEWHLDEPDKNTITVQNYKTRFEDLFQRISAAVQTVQYNEATYAKTSTLLDADGMLNPGMLIDSLNSISGQRYTLTSDGSITIDGENILIQNLTNPTNRVIINNRGIQVSEDGGINWTPVIDGRGINAGAVYTGSLNTDNIIIGNREYPSFRWDKSGISAYKQQDDETQPYDLQTFVRFDQYGLYGIKENADFTAKTLDDVLDKAHFAVTWDGFFIRNSYEGGGRVEITSDNDFRVLNTVNGVENEKIKIGALEWGEGITSPDAPGATSAPTLYGIRMLNNAGEEVMKTGDDGNLTIIGTIEALGANFSKEVTVGKNDPTETSYILIDGVNSAIQSVGGVSDWKIDKNGDAIFNNITARGAIKTAVFEYAEVQAVGGIFIFRPSSTIKTAILGENEEDIIVTIDRGKEFLFKSNDWCKVSNYTEDIEIGQQLVNSGLANIYKIEKNDTEITLIGAAEMLSGDTKVIDLASDLVGGALINMGNENKTANYGIGINSSDNAVNLPPRSLSLFETTIHSNDSIKASYDYKSVLGTLPELDYQSQTPKVSQLYHEYLRNTQGIYTDNIYIGDKNSYLAFYTDSEDNNKKKLRINGADIYLTFEEGQQEQDLVDVINGIETSEGLILTVTSSNGTEFNSSNIETILTAHLYKDGEEIPSYAEITALGYQINWYYYTENNVTHQLEETLIKANSLTCNVGINGDVEAIDLINIIVKVEDIPDNQGD